ncbi:hypothetical protein PV326_004636, partial [Microctonus aethiopoides]
MNAHKINVSITCLELGGYCYNVAAEQKKTKIEFYVRASREGGGLDPARNARYIDPARSRLRA